MGVPKIQRIEIKTVNGENEIVATMILSERFFSPGIFAAKRKTETKNKAKDMFLNKLKCFCRFPRFFGDHMGRRIASNGLNYN